MTDNGEQLTTVTDKVTDNGGHLNVVQDNDGLFRYGLEYDGKFLHSDKLEFLVQTLELICITR